MSTDVLSLPDAESLAERLTLLIDTRRELEPDAAQPRYAADRERVASDLAGLRHHWTEADVCPIDWRDWPCDDARRYSDGLRRTAALYGVTL